MLKQGPREQEVLKMALRSRRPIPDAIQNAPRLGLGLELYFEAYCDLDSERLSAFNFGRIPWSKVQAYAEQHTFSPVQTERLHHHVRVMEKTHREFQEYESKKRNKK